MRENQNLTEMKSLYVWFLTEAKEKGFNTLILCIALFAVSKMWVNEQEENRAQNREWITILSEVVQKNTTVIEMNREQGERVEKLLTRLESDK